MYPVLWKIPGLGWDVPAYGTALMVAFLVSIWWAAQRALKSGANPDVVLNCGFIALLGGVLGSRVMYVWHYWEQFARQPNVLMAIVDVRKGGLEVYGGVIVVVIGVLLYLRLGRHSLRWYLDIMAPSAALGMGLGRIGCFLNGCCWGGVCDLPWAVQFPYGSPAEVRQWSQGEPGAGLPQELVYTLPGGAFADGATAQPVTRDLVTVGTTDAAIAAAQKTEEDWRAALAAVQKELQQAADPQARAAIAQKAQALERQRQAVMAPYIDIRTQMQRYGMSAAQLRDLARHYHSLPVHPVQLYSTVTLVLLAGLLSAVYWRRTRDGQVICVFLLIEPLTRWMLEVLRADNPVDTLGAFTISQLLAVALSAIGLLGLLWLQRKPPRSPRAVLWEPPPDEVRGTKKTKKTASPA